MSSMSGHGRLPVLTHISCTKNISRFIFKVSICVSNLQLGIHRNHSLVQEYSLAVECLRVNSSFLCNVSQHDRVIGLCLDDLTEQGLLQIDQHQPNHPELQNIDMELPLFLSPLPMEEDGMSSRPLGMAAPPFHTASVVTLTV